MVNIVKMNINIYINMRRCFGRSHPSI